MRSLKKNQQPLYYATYSEEIPVYELDENGNIQYVEVDGELKPIELGKVAGYNKPVLFSANIAMSGGEAESREFGMDIADYEAVIVTTQMDLPLTETSIIWWGSEPQYNADGTVNGDLADYKVVSVRKSLNSMKYLLKKLPKGN